MDFNQNPEWKDSTRTPELDPDTTPGAATPSANSNSTESPDAPFSDTVPNPPTAPNPWRAPFDMILGGLVLTFFNLSSGLISHFFTVTGYLLLVFGSRRLSRINPYLRRGEFLAAFLLVWHTFWIIAAATPFSSIPEGYLLAPILGASAQLALLWEFRQGLLEVYRTSGQIPARDPLRGALILFCLPLALTFFGWVMQGWAALIYAGFYIAVLRSLSKLGDELAQIENPFKEAPVKIQGAVLGISYLGGCAILLVLCCFYFNHSLSAASAFLPAEAPGVLSSLSALGIPSDIVSDLAPEDADLLTKAFCAKVEKETLIFYDENTSSRRSKKEDAPQLQTTTVFALCSDHTLYVLEHFRLKQGNAYWQDGFSLRGGNDFSLRSGLLLYDNGQGSYGMPIPRLKQEGYTSSSWMGEIYTETITGAVNYPLGAENQRGYILYQEHLSGERPYTDLSMYFAHFTNPFRFPYENTEDRILSGELTSDRQRQLFLNFESPALP